MRRDVCHGKLFLLGSIDAEGNVVYQPGGMALFQPVGHDLFDEPLTGKEEPGRQGLKRRDKAQVRILAEQRLTKEGLN